MDILTKQDIFDLLKKRKIKFEYQDHIPLYTMEDAKNAALVNKGIVLKNLFVRDKKGTAHFLVCVPGDTAVDLKELAAAFGQSSLSMASPERLMEQLGVMPGAVSPFNALHNPNIPVVWSKTVKDSDIVGVHPNDNSCTVWIRSMDLQMLLMRNGNMIVKKDF